MNISFRQATLNDSTTIATLVVDLTKEICERANAPLLTINLSETIERCEHLMKEGHYTAMIGECDNQAVAVATITETYALYAGGTIGLIQEFYVSPEFRSSGVGSMLIEQVQQFGDDRKWACIELCTPPLPEFERTLQFYQNNGLTPVGGRKMRQTLSE